MSFNRFVLLLSFSYFVGGKKERKKGRKKEKEKPLDCLMHIIKFGRVPVPQMGFDYNVPDVTRISASNFEHHYRTNWNKKN
ncbi:hypothetical protein BKA67DRAFT_267001 [Truncatella angustata]|uniref:Uncharacterized protein n=1 Tax=Truncatella angustata TaxID=152316 RepID=A0A9P8ZWQ6_9PEZI|nr:uncharacterized protein BKA67DRAFT_267001 [Truncatella angustata]KAH6653987.1 hypothetical protein BKA67DRAFT_267001 [Truncatella angustata]